MSRFDQLFTERQLVALVTFSDLTLEVSKKVKELLHNPPIGDNLFQAGT
jgi:adenine-specific DNA methylase